MNHIKTLLCMGIAATLGATAWIATPTDAAARSQSGMLGSARSGADAACFLEANGGVHRVGCLGTAKSWVIPVVYDNAGNMNIRVMARGAGSGVNNVSCTAFSMTSGGAVVVGSWKKTTLNTGAPEPLDVSVNAQGFGGTWVMCSMDPDTRILHTSY
jgi:hypothetical protein